MTASAPAATATSARRPHLYEIDVLRILTFACVIMVHVLSNTAPADDYVQNGLLALVHFTREVFFALTTFVLLYGLLVRPQPMSRFWPRRFLLVGVPYVVWSVIYWAISLIRSPGDGLGPNLLNLGLELITGKAYYHLYFLLVTMQVYLLVPLLVLLVVKTRGHHRMLLVVVFVLQLAITGFYQYGPSAPIRSWESPLFVSYLFFIVAGGVAADHAGEFLAWIRAHRGLIGWLVLGGAAFMIGAYLLQHFFVRHMSLTNAGTPLQPAEMVWSVTVGLAFLAVGTWWSDRRVPGSRMARAVDRISDRSFGIFLSHPLVLFALLNIGDAWVAHTITSPWLTIIAYPVVVLSAYVIADLARRSPLSLPLAGRRFEGWPKKPTVD